MAVVKSERVWNPVTRQIHEHCRQAYEEFEFKVYEATKD